MRETVTPARVALAMLAVFAIMAAVWLALEACGFRHTPLVLLAAFAVVNSAVMLPLLRKGQES